MEVGLTGLLVRTRLPCCCLGALPTLSTCLCLPACLPADMSGGDDDAEYYTPKHADQPPGQHGASRAHWVLAALLRGNRGAFDLGCLLALNSTPLL
jgi:hypothetical protein